MIAANEQVATVLAERGEPTLYRVHEEPDPSASSAWSRSWRRSRCRRRRSASGSRPSQAGELVGLISQAVERHVRRGGRGAPRVRLARPALAQAGLVLAAQHRPRRAALAALLPLHLADPPLPRPRLPPRAARRDRRGRRPPPAPAELGELGQWSSLREREAAESSAPPTTSRAASCSSARTASASGTARSSA